jgi:hypothetical protein
MITLKLHWSQSALPVAVQTPHVENIETARPKDKAVKSLRTLQGIWSIELAHLLYFCHFRFLSRVSFLCRISTANDFTIVNSVCVQKQGRSATGRFVSFCDRSRSIF